jgi:hypothetical protein
VAYLLWWVKDGPAPSPLVTTGNPTNPLAGVLGQPDTRVLFGGSGLDYGAFSGLRGTLGLWLDEDGRFGLEGGGFLLERRGVGFTAGSDPQGSPPLVVPFLDPVGPLQTGAIVASPTGQAFAGSLSVASKSRLWGFQANTVLAWAPESHTQLEFLAGYRHLVLREEISFIARNRDLTADIQNSYQDRFTTGNYFDGGQLGARLRWQSERLSLLLGGQVALGSAFQTVARSGAAVQTGADAFAPGAHAGGILVQPSSIGRQTNAAFAVVPSAELRLGVRLLTCVSASVGYDFLYWGSVARPGAQIDPMVNPSQSPIFGGGALVGPARPAPLFQRSDFFAHGVSFALECRF